MERRAGSLKDCRDDGTEPLDPNRDMTTGNRVVCIDGEFELGIRQFYDELPVQGVTYTVRDICPGRDIEGQPEVAIRLVELVNPTQGGSSIERAFNAGRFAPLEELPDSQAADASYVGQPTDEVFV